MNPRAIDDIYLRPTGSVQGGMYVFDLKTARRVHRMIVTPAHMTDTVIKRVEAIASVQKAITGLHFGDINGNSTILDIDTASAGSDDDASDGTFYDDDESVDTALTGVVSEDEIVNDNHDSAHEYDEYRDQNNDNVDEEAPNEELPGEDIDPVPALAIPTDASSADDSDNDSKSEHNDEVNTVNEDDSSHNTDEGDPTEDPNTSTETESVVEDNSAPTRTNRSKMDPRCVRVYFVNRMTFSCYYFGTLS